MEAPGPAAPIRRKAIPGVKGAFALAGLIALGMLGNYFKFTLFFNADFIFGSIFAMLALQLFGTALGSAAALLMSLPLVLLWGHPYALVIMTAEVAVVGWLESRHRIGYVQADVLYWLLVGMPLVYLSYHLVMKVPQGNTLFIMVKDSVNGLANVLVARLAFSGVRLLRRRSSLAYREAIYNTLAFFVLGPALLLLAIESRQDFKAYDRQTRDALTQDARRTVYAMQTWAEHCRDSIVDLAELAASVPPRQLQLHLEQARKSDRSFLRVGLIDRNATSYAFCPLVDELGKPTIGRNWADRPFIPILRQSLKPMFTEAVIAKVGRPTPIVALVAPIVARGKYQGYAVGVLDTGPIQELLAQEQSNTGVRFTLLDRNGRVILSNRADQKVMAPFLRGQGALQRLEDGLSQWTPILPSNTPAIERWSRTYYVAESGIGDLAEWKLILEQPLAPFQKALFDRYSRVLSLLLLMVILSLAVAELVSKVMTRSIETLGEFTRNLPARLAARGPEIDWPHSGLQESNHLISNFRLMAASLSEQLDRVRQANETLEQRVEDRTHELAESEARFRIIAEGSPVALFLHRDGKFIYVNPAALHLLGYTDASQLVGQSILDRVHPDDREQVQERVRRALGQGSEMAPIQERFLTRDGTPVSVEVTGRTVIYQGQATVLAFAQDITERIKAQEDLKRLLREQEIILGNANVGISLVIDRKQAWINPWMADVFQYAASEMVGQTTRMLYQTQEAYDRLGEEAYPVLAGGGTFETVQDLIRKDGQHLWVRYSGRAVDPSDMSKGVLWILSDVTAQKAAEDALKESEARFRLLAENASDVIWTTDPQGRFTYLSPSVEKLRGFAPSEAMHQTLEEILTPASMELVRQALQSVPATAVPDGPSSAFTCELEEYRRDGSTVWTEVKASLLRGENGQATGIFGVTRDITERRAQALELERLNHLYDTLSHIGLSLTQVQTREELLQDICRIVVDKGGFRLAWVGWLDDASRRVVPLAMAGEAVGYLDGILISVDDRPEGRGPTSLCIREDRIQVCQDFLLDPRTLPWCAKAEAFGLRGSAAVPIHVEGKVAGALMIYASEANIFQAQEVALLNEVAATVGFGLDHLAAAEKQRQLEAQVTRTQKMESLGILAGGVAHDMNNVLGAILGLASVHTEIQPEGSPAQRAFATITKACTRGGDLIRRLLSLARQGLAEEKELDMNALIQEGTRLLERTTLAKVRLEMDLASDLRSIRGDASALSHVLMNLCVNAVQAMPEQGTLNLRTRNLDHDWIEVQVEDNGCGMTKEVLDKAMDPFFTTKDQGKGTGLGLSITHSTIMAHHGQMEIHSEPGQGTRVLLRFPACDARAQAPEAASMESEGPPGASLEVYLIDDDDLIQSSVRSVLETLGHRVSTALCGEDALARLEGGYEPDVVILDMNMPGLGGAGTLARLRALRPLLPVLLATGRVDQAALDLVKAHPHVTLMSKPFSMQELQAHLESHPKGAPGPQDQAPG